MLSVLVPIYNVDVCAFVAQLSALIEKGNIAAEIICIDDCSSQEYKNVNAKIANTKHVTYYELTVNNGRSKIRNLLANKAQYEWLLFMDCDSAICTADFFDTYLSVVSPEVMAVYGGTMYAKKPVDTTLYLHWLYGTTRECVSVDQRNKNPYGTFKTNNFLIRKSVFEKVRFNEEIKEYGHEDTLFAKDLDRHGVRLLHIENPLIHCGLEENSMFIAKQKKAIVNLAGLYKKNLVGNEIRLVRFYNFVKKWRLMFLVKWTYLKNEEKLIANLLSSEPVLTNLDRLKLKWFIAELAKK